MIVKVFVYQVVRASNVEKSYDFSHILFTNFKNIQIKKKVINVLTNTFTDSNFIYIPLCLKFKRNQQLIVTMSINM